MNSHQEQRCCKRHDDELKLNLKHTEGGGVHNIDKGCTWLTEQLQPSSVAGHSSKEALQGSATGLVR